MRREIEAEGRETGFGDAEDRAVQINFGDLAGRFELDEGRITRYSEVFDRGMALAQVGFTPERLKKIGLRYAEELKRLPAIRPHLADR